MQRSTEGILTTHTGSLPRSEQLTQLVYASQEGESVVAELEERFPQEVVDIVGKQKAAGISVVNDGEVTKPGFANYIRTRLEGMGDQAEAWSFADLDEVPDLKAAQYSTDAAQHIHMPACIGELRYVGQAERDRDIEALKAAMRANDLSEAFMTAVSPGTIAYHCSNQHYSEYEDYLMAAAETMREEYEAIAAAGLILQLDCPDLPCTSPDHCQFWASDVVEKMGHRGLIELHLNALNKATANIDPGQLRMHLCWGNYEGPHTHDVPLGEVIEVVLERARPEAVLFEAANPRHEHEWRVFESVDVPEDKILVPGVIDTLTNFVEHPNVVADRIERFANLVGRENVIAGNDCGFGTFVGFGEVYPSVAWKKLESLSAGARIATERLW